MKAPRILSHEVLPSGDELWKVESRSEEGAAYSVFLHAEHLVCQCKGYEYRGRCAHVDVVREGLEADAQAERDRQEMSERRDTAPMWRSNAPFSIFADASIFDPKNLKAQPRQKEEW